MELVIDAELKTRKEDKKIELPGRSQLWSRRSHWSAVPPKEKKEKEEEEEKKKEKGKKKEAKEE